MSVFFSFFTNQESSPPDVTPALIFSCFTVLLLLTYTSLRFYRHKVYRSFFKGVQLLQMSLLYSWYLLMAFSLTDSLPFYHCRMAMFAIVFLPDRHPWKRYFALIGFVGSILSFVSPVFDNYPVGHVTIFSYIIGHFALFVNCLVYLLQDDEEQLTLEGIVLGTLSLNTFLSIVNVVTGGNYGFLRVTPLIGEVSAPVRFVAVSAVLILLVSLLNHFFAIKGKQVRESVMEKIADMR